MLRSFSSPSYSLKTAAQNLKFEKAAQLRDQIVEMRQIMLFKETEGI